MSDDVRILSAVFFCLLFTKSANSLIFALPDTFTLSASSCYEHQGAIEGAFLVVRCNLRRLEFREVDLNY